MTAVQPAPGDAEIAMYARRIVAHAQQRAAQMVAAASHRAALDVAMAEEAAPAIRATRSACQRTILREFVDAAEEAMAWERMNVSKRLQELEQNQLARLDALDRRLDAMAADFRAALSGPLQPPATAVAPRAVRLVADHVERATADSAHFAQLRRILDRPQLADPA